ncbi:hypothetical protein [Xenorhabdus littoralis]|uniref:hypothetical protein n=1 Tax=Xenorhabdus littoralis TaxID=2582835 RepID=UPI0029E800AA|nr:hypothetical protein [Xenorhabdus sp. Reich]
MTAFYRLNLALPSDIPQEQARLALETLAGAYEVAGSLMNSGSQQLMNAAAYSFTNAIHITSWLITGLTGIAVLVTWYLLRKAESH